jgi:TetR/AcrR family transcriptional repressor of nem operon
MAVLEQLMPGADAPSAQAGAGHLRRHGRRHRVSRAVDDEALSLEVLQAVRDSLPG